MLLQLLSKIEDSLAKLADENAVFGAAYTELHKVEFNKIGSYQYLKDILADCYKYLINQENKGKLTLNERVLLNNIDRLDDLMVEGKM
ncbi:hypothetical protein [Lactobacillus gallinarum]|uniref:Uncharacterized protein n=2 Tax=Lactobacillus gallinarum TaxID=52242 RepID=A0A1Y4VW68_9LACO|nr:hypothetical protein [Lactobacillus gallinarum]OUQ55162.1 hypothetical protein B5E59_08530 [Lactobacillus gallinarum]OUQ74367.1 hypothetical protein B5E44_09925 [Lactobacillus gallinarum]